MSAVASMVNMSKAWVDKAIKRFRETGSNKDRAKKGRPRNKRTAATIRKVRGRIDRKSRRSIRLMSREINMAHSTMAVIVKKDLGFKSRAVQRRHFVSGLQKTKRQSPKF
jgi:transposase